MTLIEALRASPALLTLATAVLGLIVGSFLNVLILRLPQMMARAWQREARALLELDEVEQPALSLTQPASACPQCHAPIKPWHNIPVLSWLWLRGRCAHCRARISIQYPLVELASAGLSAVCAQHFGWGVPLAAALVLTWTLLALAVIDLHTTLLPDDLTLPLLWLGLALALLPVFAPLQDAVIGAMAGYLMLWAVFWLFKLITGKEGMGYGDFKLLAALGAWLGWQALPMVILLSSLVGAVVGIGMVVFLRHDRRVPIPFGPYLAAAGWLALLYGDVLQNWYLARIGIG
ncbi:A24 family peptidase [Sinimarinibacterium sp. NLF-5-8]|uniref:prepilin peptidase n=1 Tax=Sinimarinibacterium sp. NLF-5-8 TaxID=2698684 RepID=UPI00137C03A4|nr:A24 family peptidase [Sinimarinibacterium sp. NLF-5-8]QHS11075.1 prepilin peptidase [Sinimarinibacterium sp. NLF-5-8]